MTHTVYAVFLANIRSLRAQVLRSFRSRWGSYAVLAIVFLGVAGINLSFYNIFKTIPIPLFSAQAPSAEISPAAINPYDIVHYMALNFFLSGSLISLCLCVLTPIKSHIGLAAKIFGARQAAINAGEALSTFAVSGIIVIGLQLAFFWYLAEQSPKTALTMATLLLASMIFIGTTLLLKNIFQAFYERLLKINSEVSAMLSVLSALILLVAIFTDIIRSAFSNSEPVLDRALNALWLGETLPHSLPVFLANAAALLATLTLLVLSYHFQTDKSVLYNFSRLLVRHPPASSPRKFRNFIFRELLVSFRHPNSQATFIITLLLTAILAAAARANLIFPALALYLCIFFCTTGAELAYGRTVTAHWIYQGANYGVTKVLAAKFCAVAITQGGLFLSSLFVAFPPSEALEVLPRALPVLFGLLSLSFFCGVLIPYSDTAPLSMLGAYALLILLDVGALYVEGKLAEYHEIFAILFGTGIGALALLSCVLLAKRDTSVTGQGR